MAEDAITTELKGIASELLAPDVTFDLSQQHYDRWAKDGTYDEMIKDERNYTAPSRLYDKMIELFPDPEAREQAIVLDIGAGTGILAEGLVSHGFKHFHALEPLASFVSLARAKGLYHTIYPVPIGDGSQVECPTATYDVVIACGAFGPGHIPCDAFHEIIRVLKPGGYFINCMRHSYLQTTAMYRDRLKPLADQLVNQGEWTQLAWDTYPNHFLGHEGLLMVFQKHTVVTDTDTPS